MVPLIMFVMSAGPLAGAYLSQYGFGYQPCPLCLYQRVPYFVIAGVSILMLLLAAKSSVPRFLFLCALLFLINAGIAGFHTGVEQHWWEGLEGCQDNIVAETIEDLRAKIMATPIARCDEPAFLFLGLSMAAWNAFYATGAAIFTFMLFGRYVRD